MSAGDHKPKYTKEYNMNVGDKLTLAVRVGKHPNPEKTETLCRCWPISTEGRAVMETADITEILFNGKQSVFTVGSEITGEAVVTSIDDAKAYDETGKLQPRFKLDEDGLPVKKNGKDAVLQKISIRWISGDCKRANPAEEVLKVA